MGRLADALGATFLGYACLHHYARSHGKTADDGLRTVAEHALLGLEKEAHDALRHAAANVPPMPLGAHRAVGALLETALRPVGGRGAPDAAPSDALVKACADLLTTRDSAYAETFLAGGAFTSAKIQKRILDALPLCLEADGIAAACKRAERPPTADEADAIARADAARDAIVQVQAFEKLGESERTDPAFERPALAQTAAWLAESRPGVAAAAP